MKKIIIGILVVLIIAITSVIILMPKNSKDSKNEIATENQEQLKEESPIIEDKTIRMTVAGDILCHNTNFWDAYNPSLDSYDFSYTFEDIKKYFDTSDIAIGTLECNYAGKAAGYSNYPLFNAPEDMATDLKELGFDVLATANNHCLDKGYAGLINTLAELDKAGIEHMGTYSSEEASKEYLIKDVNGIKMAFLNYTYGTNGIAIPSGKEYAVNFIDKEKIKNDLENVKQIGVDVICVNMHWGQEYKLVQNKEQEELADFLFQNGVDLILGSHTHCLEPMEKRKITLEDGTEKEVFVIYSLGNFMSGQNADNSRQSVILDIELTKKGKDGKIVIDKVEYTPIYMYNYYTSKSAKRFKILDIEAEIAKYEAGNTGIGSSMYNTLKKELQGVYSIMGNEILKNDVIMEEE